jgi:DNA-binding Xre family transcriptional regulator
MKDVNRIKVVLAEKKRTAKWLSEQIGRNPATVSKWCTNTIQPSMDTLLDIANALEMNIQDLLIPTNQKK